MFSVVLFAAHKSPPLIEAVKTFDGYASSIHVISTHRMRLAGATTCVLRLTGGVASEEQPIGLADGSWRFWRRYRANARARALVAAADAAVAVDETTIYTVWQIARAYPTLVTTTSAATALGELEVNVR